MIDVRVFPCLTDNYGFLVRDKATGEVAAVDTPDGDAVLAAAQDAGWTITQIWNTHHHGDHVGGNLAVKAATNAPVIAPAAEADKIPGVDRTVAEGDRFALGGLAVAVMETGGHTLGHVSYRLPQAEAVFVGDTVFAMGCGRVFEGTMDQMWASVSKIAALPSETIVYCAHEYTVANAAFCLTIEPGNAALQARAETVNQMRAENRPTVPTRVGEELATNVFLRPQSREVRARLGLEEAGDAEVFAALRRRKDTA